MKSDKSSETIAFAPEEEIVLPDFLQQNTPRRTMGGISGAIWGFMTIVLIPALLIKFLCFCCAVDNPFELAFAFFDIYIIYYYMRDIVYSYIRDGWFYRYGIIAIATIVPRSSVKTPMDSDYHYTYYSYKTLAGREFESFLDRTYQHLYEYLEVGDRIIVLYNRRFPKWHIRYGVLMH
jgi:hypothetical protein